MTLIDPVSGTPLGHSRVEEGRDDLLNLVDRISIDLSQFLRPALGQEVRIRELRGATDNNEAWGLVWRAESVRESHHAMIEASERERADRILAQADSLLVQAESLDPDWVEPVILRGWIAVDRALVFAEQAGEFDAEDRPLVEAALAKANQALSLDPGNADALALRGSVTFGLSRIVVDDSVRSVLLDEAERDLRSAGEASPAQAGAWVRLGELLQYHRVDFVAAKQAYEQALSSDPFLLDAEGLALNVGSLATDLEEWDEAWHWYQEGRRRWPDNVRFPALGLATLASTSGLGGPENAWALADTIMQTLTLDRFPEFEPIWQAHVSTVLWRSGLADSARAVLLHAEAITLDSGFVAGDLAHAWLVQGDVDRCLDWLAIDLEANPELKAYRSTEPWFRPLHDDPRFQALVRTEEADSG